MGKLKCDVLFDCGAQGTKGTTFAKESLDESEETEEVAIMRLGYHSTV